MLSIKATEKATSTLRSYKEKYKELILHYVKDEKNTLSPILLPNEKAYLEEDAVCIESFGGVELYVDSTIEPSLYNLDELVLDIEKGEGSSYSLVAETGQHFTLNKV
ncbi:MAG: DUF779 domain-containing protein [Flavobacteriales bacterium]|jgi:uncharacterized protein (DUF779 family)|nr:DUF779 domain-containing protein [Flavobacteriales bacterium]